MKKLSILLAAAITFVSCSDDDGGNTTVVTKADVVENYANLVHQSYQDSYDLAVKMQTAINVFVTTPNQANFDAAKKAWLDAREPYGQTEAYRECNGPVDTDESTNTPWGLGNEGQMNAWPIDESYIDYVQAGTEAYANDYASVIGNTALTINEALIIDLNEKQDDKSISTGWHAVEFLLWGQDNTAPSEDKTGLRMYTDYTTADHATRRGQYLKVATDLLVKDLKALVDTWNTGGTYRTVFMDLDKDTALKQLINGAFFIAGDELSSERMIAPVDSTDGVENSGQEDEHSCFSDNTHRDIFANAQGVMNVIYGSYGSVNGASFYTLVQQTNADQAAKLKAAADDAMAKVNVIANHAEPFDLLITKELSTDSNFGPVMSAVKALKTLGDEISASATVVGINL